MSSMVISPLRGLSAFVREQLARGHAPAVCERVACLVK